MNRVPLLPANFRFGMATSAHQIEGAARSDGKGISIWNTFEAESGRIRHGENADVAIDHFHRVAEDVGHIADCGVQDYRFSLSWPRIVPAGTGRVEPRGLDFYDSLVDALLASGVRPVPTLYHWDLPQALEDRGGWMSRDTALAFADYSAVVAARLGDRVGQWITLNEMNVHTLYGYALADHAPGRGLGMAALPSAHHQLLGHGLAVQALRAAGATSVGVASQHFPVVAASDDYADQVAAETFSALTNWTFSDPLLLGRYPSDEILSLMPGTESAIAADLEVISAPLDFYGVNFYEPTRIEAPKAGKDYAGTLEVDIPEGLPFSPVAYETDWRTDFGWAVVPDALRDILLRLTERYPDLPPVIITENGASFHDAEPDSEGRVHDADRVRFLEAHLDAVVSAIDAGVDVQGYYVWSAFDNFEWAAGYDERFGLVYVDRETLERTRKDSWYWYQSVIAGQGLPA